MQCSSMCFKNLKPPLLIKSAIAINTLYTVTLTTKTFTHNENIIFIIIMRSLVKTAVVAVLPFVNMFYCIGGKHVRCRDVFLDGSVYLF